MAIDPNAIFAGASNLSYNIASKLPRQKSVDVSKYVNLGASSAPMAMSQSTPQFVPTEFKNVGAVTTPYGGSTKWEKFRLLLLNDRKLRRLERRLTLVKAAYHPFTLHIGVLEKGIPQIMANYVAIIEEQNRPVMDNNLVFVEISDSGDAERAPFGKRTLSATVFVKESPLVLNNQELKDISETVLRKLETFLPFLAENIDFLNIDKSIELSRKYQDVANQKYRLRSESFFGMVNMPNKTPLRNVTMTGGMLLAGLGFEGEILSGMNAAHSILQQEGKKYG